MDSTRFLIIGASGQLGGELRDRYPQAQFADRGTLDITNPTAVAEFDWSMVDVILNAAAYTNVDEAETTEGRRSAWNVNAMAVASISHIASRYGLLLIHISTDYVFDGTQSPHTETEPFSPLSVYGASKAAGDIAAGLTEKHYILRTSWVIGEGKNFVRTMLDLGKKGVNPTVVSDQVGRLTFTSELVRAIDHILKSDPPFGVYNISNGGDPVSWAEITREIFKQSHLANTVSDISTADYYQNKPGAAPRPLQSTLDLAKLKATGFEPVEWRNTLANYIKKELTQ